VACVVGTLATLGAVLLVCFWEYRVAEIDFQSKANGYVEVIDADLGDSRTLLYTIAAHIASIDHPVSAREFGDFSAALHRRVSGLRDTAWAPHVTRVERAAFELAARAAGLAGYGIVQLGPHGNLIPAGQRGEYYALLYFEAGGKKRAVLGFDLISESARAAAARRALQTGQPAATAPMDVLTVRTPGAGVLAYMPVYRLQPAIGSASRSAQGLVLGVFDIHEMVEKILARKKSMSGLNLYLYNLDPRARRHVIYRTHRWDSTERPLSEPEMLAGAHWQGTVSLIDQRIGAIVTPAHPLHFLRPTLFAIATLLVGIAMTAMIAAYIILSLRRTAQLESLTATLNASNEHITRVSLHDALTGLPNRLLFHDRMEQATAGIARDSPFALLFLDLDRFKVVNDTLGHAAGDQLLCQVAERIAGNIRDEDTAARLGGDEFAIILSHVGDSATVALLANRLIAAISKPYLLGDQPATIGVSIGASIGAPNVAAAEIVAQADLAMYAAKEAGRGTFRTFEERLRTRVDQKRVLENDLRDALERDELEVHYQPLMNLADLRVSSFEALARWRHPELGPIPPDRFIAVAEECGLIGQLGLRILQIACRDAAGWPRPVKVAVNVSPRQFASDALLADIFEVLRKSGLPPERLELELTEAAVLHDSEITRTTLVSLRAAGVSVALDDFGTGYSSLSSLLRFPFDKIKIDRSFLERVDTSPSAAPLVRGVIALATTLNLTTTGEGVETRGQLEYLRACGCSEAQGFFFSPARPNADVAGLLSALDTDAHASVPAR
jgi:diguanylate cyclase (GGDEF)-like protein